MQNFFNAVLGFDSMLTPKIIAVGYWMGLSLILLGSLGAATSSGAGLFTALIAIPFGFISLRILCEVLIVLFKINENIQKIADRSNTDISV